MSEVEIETLVTRVNFLDDDVNNTNVSALTYNIDYVV